MENSYHQTTRRNFLNQLGLAAAGMTTGNTALATTQYDSGIPRNSVPDRTSDNSAKRVIMISLDGICVEGFQKAHAPSLKGMMSQGAFSLDTRVVMPSVTLPNWTSHLTGSGPEQHGVFNNNWTPANSSYPAVRRDEDGYYPSVFQALKKCQPSLFNDTHFLFLTDHGGIGKGHGGTSAAEMIVPWGISGPGIKRNFLISEPNNTPNTAPMLLHLFGGKPLPEWTGKVIESVFPS